MRLNNRFMTASKELPVDQIINIHINNLLITYGYSALSLAIESPKFVEFLPEYQSLLRHLNNLKLTYSEIKVIQSYETFFKKSA